MGAGTSSVAYSNPYYEAPPATEVPANYIDYSQPLLPPAEVINSAPTDVPTEIPAVAPPTATADEDAQQLAVAFMNAAREAFKAKDYAKALEQVEKAIRQVPNDPALHEFRALVLFAQGKYRDASAAIYTVLAAGPGWNWATVKDLYPDTDTYANQLKALEAYAKANPDKSEAPFLLAYHYLVLGETQPAVKQLEVVTKLLPKDELAPQMIKVLKSPPEDDTGKPKPGQ